ncbi:MAG TPA: hypothetical protein VK137_06390 [Planctomycetaceae bacterium]|nr:hypothetical protein [Planctomycetaceae bacterium]
MDNGNFGFWILDFGLGGRRQAILILVILSCLSSARADDAVTIARVERWSSVFAESETRWTYRFSAEQPFRDRVAWRLTANQRTLASGELQARGEADKPGEVILPLRWPKVKEGTALAAQLSVSVGEVRHEQTVWIFPRDPLVDRREWLQSLKLNVFDPPGDTLKVLKESDVPHERLRTREALDDVTEGIVIVGEGVSLKKHDGLIDDLWSLAARGVPVLCLASADGEFSFPSEKPLATSVQLRRSDVIRELDKRLDTAWWPNGSSQLQGLRVTSVSDDVVVKISDDAKAWPWAEWEYEMGSGSDLRESPLIRPRVIWCGFGIVTAWDDGPTPRYLFAKLLERLSINSVPHSSQEK